MPKTADNNNLASIAKKSANSSESIRVSIEVDEERRKNFKHPPAPNVSGKYLRDEKLREEVKATLSRYIGESCTLEQVQIRIRDNEKRGYVARVKIKGNQEIKVSEFLNENFCKDKKISRFTLMTDDGKNSISCDIDENGTRYYKVQNGPPMIMTINWYVGEKKCTIEVELGVNSFKIINLNGVTDKELAENKKVRIGDRPREGLQDNAKSLVESVQSALQSTSPKSTIEKITLITPGMQSAERVTVCKINKECEKVGRYERSIG